MFKKIILYTLLIAPLMCFASQDNPEAAQTNARLGLAYLQKDMYQASKESLMTALREDPDIASPWYSMGYYYEKTDNATLAAQYYKKAMDVEPNSGAAKNNYGTFLCRTGNYREGIKLFLTAAHDSSYLNVGSAYENAGICALMMKNNSLAMNYFKEALHNNPDRYFSLLCLARLESLNGRNARAEYYFSQFKKIMLQHPTPAVLAKYHRYVFAGASRPVLPMP